MAGRPAMAGSSRQRQLSVDLLGGRARFRHERFHPRGLAAIPRWPPDGGRAAGLTRPGQSCATSGLAASGLARRLNRRLA